MRQVNILANPCNSDAIKTMIELNQDFSWDFAACKIIWCHKCKIWRLAYAICRSEIIAKLIALLVLFMFWAIFKNFKQILCTFIHILGSFVVFDAYFKALIHFDKRQLGKCLFSQQLLYCFFLGFVGNC